MRVVTAQALLVLSLSIYILSAIASLILAKKQKACNLVSNILCMAAAAAGLAAALVHLLTGEAPVIIHILHQSIPLISLDITMDSLSALFILGLSLLAFCTSLYSIGYIAHYYGQRNVGLFNFLYSTFIFSMALVLTSGNAVLFLFAWEAMSALSYLLVVFESEKEENRRAGTLYLIMTGIGTAFLMIGFMLMYGYTGSFDLFGSSEAIPPTVKHILFACLLVGFGTKAGVVPLHIWLPAAHPAAPGNVSALMSGVMINTAVYGLVRLTWTYLGVQSTWWGVALLAVGIVSAVLGAAYAAVENDIKRLLAYSSIENMGIVFMGLGVGALAFAGGSRALGAVAVAAALFHAFNHTLIKGGLFMGAGAIQTSTHTRSLEELGGLIRRLPATAVFMLCGSLAIAAIVPFNGFAGEWLLLQALFAGIVPGQAGLNLMMMLAVAALGLAGALAAMAFMKLFGIAFLGRPRTEKAASASPIPVAMDAAMGILTVLCLVVGFVPGLFIQLADRVMVSLVNESLTGLISGWFTLQGAEAALEAAALSPVTLACALAALALGALLVVRLVGGRQLVRKYGTWDCGYRALDERMQYSATGFAKPLKIVFRILFRPMRELKVGGSLTYHPETMEYKTSSESVIEKYLYGPVLGFVKGLAGKMKYSVQTGSVRRYLAYIFIALLALMLYNAFV